MEFRFPGILEINISVIPDSRQFNLGGKFQTPRMKSISMLGIYKYFIFLSVLILENYTQYTVPIYNRQFAPELTYRMQ